MSKKKLTFEIGANTKQFFAALAKIQRAIRRLSTMLKTALKPATMFLGAINAISGAALTLGIRRLAAFGAEMNHTAAATGATVDKLAILNQAFQDAGLSEQDLRPTINAMQRYISESIQMLDNPRIKQMWEALKLDPRQLQAIDDPTKQFTVLLKQLHEIPDATERAAVAMQMFRGRGPKLLAINLASIQDAEKSLGSLPDRLSKMHVQLERIDTILGRMKTKVHQFFAGFVGQHIDKLEAVMEKINSIDFAPLGEKLASMLAGVFSGIQKLVRMAFSGDLWKFLKHKILELAHMIGFAIKSAIHDVLSQVKIPGKDGDYSLLEPVIATKSPEAMKHKKAADKLWENTSPILESLGAGSLKTFIKRFLALDAPKVRNQRFFSADPDGTPAASLTPNLSAPVVSALQSLGGGGNIGQSGIPSIQQNTAKANQLTLEHINVSRQILNSILKPMIPAAPSVAPFPTY